MSKDILLTSCFISRKRGNSRGAVLQYYSFRGRGYPGRLQSWNWYGYSGDSLAMGLFWKKLVRVSLLDGFLNNPDCLSAFRGVGIDLEDLLTNTGLVIRLIDLAFSTYSNNALTLTSYGQQTLQTAYRDHASAAAFTGTNFIGHRPAVTDGIPHIFLNTSAFNPSYVGGRTGEEALRITLAPELIHAGGIPGDHTKTEDLRDLGERYTDVMKSCAGRT